MVKIPDEVLRCVKPFELETCHYKNISELLEINICKGLCASTHKEASVKMFPSYVTKLPSGREKGRALALDLGGTNYRVILVDLNGAGVKPKITETTYAIPHDKMTGSGSELFDYIADTMQDFLQTHKVANDELSLGFTFSFPCEQKSLNKAMLVHWTKGFSASGVEGNDVAKLLQDAIDKRGMRVKCVAVVNDTVGTLTACALQDPKCAIGLIVGTGTNAAYAEEIPKVELFNGDKTASHVIINMEWGAFGDDGSLDEYLTDYDRQLDKESLYPKKQVFEKMISGMYIGELVRLVLVDLVNKKLLFGGVMPDTLTKPNSFHTKYMTDTERDPPTLHYSTNHMLTLDLQVPIVQPEDEHIVRHVCQLVGTRAAFLAGAGVACLLNRINKHDVTVGIDGSLFKFHPKFPERMTYMTHQLKKSDTNRFVLKLSEDGSGKGAAAIAAAVTFPSNP